MTAAFPGMRGFSTRNLKYMRQFAARYQHVEFGQQAVAQLPWGHVCCFQRVKIKDACNRMVRPTSCTARLVKKCAKHNDQERSLCQAGRSAEDLQL